MHESTLHLIELIYKAAGDRNFWSEFLKEYAAIVNAETAVLISHDQKYNKPNIAESVRLDPDFNRLYESYYVNTNEWIKRGALSYVPGRIVTSQEFITDSELTKTEFFDGYLRPQNFFHSYGVIIAQDESLSSYVSCLRSRKTGRFEDPEIELLRTLIPHLQCAFRLHQRISSAESTMKALTSIFDSLHEGVVLVDQSAKPIFMNAVAEKILNRKDGIRITPAGLTASLSAETERLRGMVYQCCLAGAGKEVRTGGALRLLRSSGQRALELFIAPLCSQQLFAGQKATTVIFISDPDEQERPNQEVLRELFGLTAAESNIAADLMQGSSIEQIADERCISLNTARTHLKHILSKTETSRQGELVSILLKSVARIRSEAMRPIKN